MSFIPLPFDVIKLRHPDVADRLEKAMRASKIQQAYPSDPSEWSWGYDYWQQGRAVSLGDLMNNMFSPTPYKDNWQDTKGRERLEHCAADLTVIVQVTTGRRHKSEQLDNSLLLAGPDASLPREVLGYRLKPAGPSIWVWTSQPGAAVHEWREHVAVGAARVGADVCITLEDGDWNKVFVMQDKDGSFARVSTWPVNARDNRAIDKTIRHHVPTALSAGRNHQPVEVEDVNQIAWPQGPNGLQLLLAQPPQNPAAVWRDWDSEEWSPPAQSSPRKPALKP